MVTHREISERSEERVGDRAPCPGCQGYRLDRACDGHQIGPAVLYCGCPVCGGEDLAVTLGHSDLAALAAD